MADTKISALTALLGAGVADNDQLPIVDTSALTTKVINASEFSAYVLANLTTAINELARDAVGAALTAGGGITITPNDGADTITVAQTAVGQPAVLMIAVTDETTALTTGTAKVTFRMPFAMTLTGVRANVNTVSSSGNPAIDINENGVSIFSTTLTIDASEKSSTTAAVPAVISDASLADDSEITIDIDTAGTGAKGLKVMLIGTRA